jgi:MarR family transcriptional regulator, organic hydroperoxide resistance regulator
MGKDLGTERLWERVNRISHRIVKLSEQFDERAFHRIKNLSKIEISVLSLLCENPQMIMRDISERLQVSKSTMTGVVDKLEEVGFLQRVINKRDRRSYALEVTKEGKLAQEEHLKWEREAYLQFIEAMRACDVPETYFDQTEKILEYLEIHGKNSVDKGLPKMI